MSWFDQRPDDAMDGAFAVVGPDPVQTVDPAAFREAMSRLGAAVHIITTAGPGGKAGAKRAAE
jgi:flavin reductase